MKFTLSWLKEHLDTAATINDVADVCNRIGLEVEGIENPADRLRGFTVARVLSATRHPQADKLQVLTVDAGQGPLQVVCGAPNARAGLIGVFGVEGATVPANGMVLKKTAIRGVESNGMMCSSRELELGDDHDGIIELPGDAPVGTAFSDYAALNDPVIDVAITPNRQDCMGVRGIARDLAAAGLGTLKPLAEVYRMASLSPVQGSDPAPEVRTDDPEGCPAFFAQAVSGVTNGEAPLWMTEKLKAVGQKPISALVDITNFLSLDLGRPLHVYDRAKLTGALIARKAKDGEQVVALNGKAYTLDASMTVIADDVQVHDIAGIMGGEHSGCSADTRDVLIECAYFDPAHIARTGQTLMLTSDARQRFERGVDPAFLDEGLAIATWLVTQHCGGTPSAVTRAGTPPAMPRTLTYDYGLCARLGGIDVPQAEQRQWLEALGFGVADDGTVTIPSWRRDIDGQPDLVEEIVRMVGLDTITSTPLPRDAGVAKPTATPAQLTERKLRRTAALRGLNEAVTWSFVSERDAAHFGGGAWTLANPISEDLRVMRPSLLSGLLGAAQRNLDRGAESIRLFELGRRYLADGEQPALAFLLTGEKQPRGWATGRAAGFDAFDAKAEALALLAAAGAPVDNLQVMGEAGPSYHPGRSATLRLGPKTILAAIGQLHPRIVQAFGISGPVMAGEIFIERLPARRGSGFMRQAFAPPVLQPVRRDFAFLVPDTLAAADLVRAARGADKQNITAVRLFDQFSGAGVGEGQKSLAIDVTLQPVTASFSEADIKAISERIVSAVARIGGQLRG